MLPIVLSRLFHRYSRLLTIAFVFILVRFQHGDAEIFEAKFQLRDSLCCVFVHLNNRPFWSVLLFY
jgi:hypothetical protein